MYNQEKLNLIAVQPPLNKMSKYAIHPYSVQTLKKMMIFCPQQQLLFLQLSSLFMVNSSSGHCNFFVFLRQEYGRVCCLRWFSSLVFIFAFGFVLCFVC
mmetsp:Transcript_17691/g.27015  ORF Transcript_17691/g.27015 Transcript_17691/m.27015 type:complete len:99 (+) Transcript_17691:2317-2613(+)